MDATAQQAKVDALSGQVSLDEDALANDQKALEQAKAELAQASLINSLEALSPDEVSAINAALASDADNKTGVSIALPPATV